MVSPWWITGLSLLTFIINVRNWIAECDAHFMCSYRDPRWHHPPDFPPTKPTFHLPPARIWFTTTAAGGAISLVSKSVSCSFRHEKDRVGFTSDKTIWDFSSPGPTLGLDEVVKGSPRGKSRTKRNNERSKNKAERFRCSQESFGTGYFKLRVLTKYYASV